MAEPAIASKINQESDLNTTFGLPEGMRKAVAVGLLAVTGFLSGCAKTIQERSAEMDALPQPTISTVVDNGRTYLNQDITLKGNANYIADHSFNTTSIVLMPISNGKFTTLIPMPVTTHHPRFEYSLSDGAEMAKSLKAEATEKLPSGEVVARGHLDQKDSGSLFFNVSDAISRHEYEASRQK